VRRNDGRVRTKEIGGAACGLHSVERDKGSCGKCSLFQTPLTTAPRLSQEIHRILLLVQKWRV
jgi:hypothetical protein